MVYKPKTHMMDSQLFQFQFKSQIRLQEFSNLNPTKVKKTLLRKIRFQNTLNCSKKFVESTFILMFITLLTNSCFTCFAPSSLLGNLVSVTLKFNSIGNFKLQRRKKVILEVRKYVSSISDCFKLGYITRSKTTTT